MNVVKSYSLVPRLISSRLHKKEPEYEASEGMGVETTMGAPNAVMDLVLFGIYILVSKQPKSKVLTWDRGSSNIE